MRMQPPGWKKKMEKTKNTDRGLSKYVLKQLAQRHALVRPAIFLVGHDEIPLGPKSSKGSLGDARKPKVKWKKPQKTWGAINGKRRTTCFGWKQALIFGLTPTMEIETEDQLTLSSTVRESGNTTRVLGSFMPDICSLGRCFGYIRKKSQIGSIPYTTTTCTWSIPAFLASSTWEF